MVALLDVNVLVALFDAMHVHHQAAHEWFGRNRNLGWATCPLTENGLVRLLSNPAYPGRRTTLPDAIARMEQFRRSGNHSFWPDSITVCDQGLFRHPHIGGYRQVTDAYLLALAVRNRGRLATFDRSIPLTSVAGAGADHMALISA